MAELRSRRAIIAAILLIAALAVRVWFDQPVAYRPVFDAGSYLKLGGEVARTGNYSAHGPGANGTHGPSAYFPPGYPYFLAAVDLIAGQQGGGHGAVQPDRLAGALLGTVTAGLIGLLAWELLGVEVALIALAIAACYPVFVELSGTLLAENLLIPLELAATWAALRARRSPHPHRWIVATGVLAGAATLTHVNAAVLLIPLGVALWPAGRRTGVAPALVVAAAALTVAPWTIRNAVVMHRLIPVSDEAGITLAGTYNAASAAFEPVPTSGAASTASPPTPRW